MATPVPFTFNSRRYLRHGLLPQMVAFDAVVRLGSVTRAGEALCLAQSTVSGHLRKLGEALGVRLFTLRGKQLEPTDAARPLLAAAHEVFAALERCERELVNLRGDPPLGASRTGLPISRMGGPGNAHPPIAPLSRAHARPAHPQVEPGVAAPFR